MRYLGLIGMVLALTANPVRAAEPVTVDSIVRAETDTAFRTRLQIVGGFSKFHHARNMIRLDKQTIIRMNRDTLYSAAVLDLSKPVTITIPDTHGRYISQHVINQDHYMFVLSEPGEHVLTQENVGSRFAQVITRIFVNPNDPADIAAANAVQDELKVSGGGDGPLDVPEWNQEQLKIARDAINRLSVLGFSTLRAFGTKEETDPVDHLIGAVAAWGGMPAKEALYIFAAVDDNSGTPYVVTVRDVPVDAFWSITVYNADGFIEKNDLNAYNYNNITAKPNDDGSFSIHFGGCDDGPINCLPVTPGWNYAVRLYKPRPEILDGSWVFPKFEPAN